MEQYQEVPIETGTINSITGKPYELLVWAFSVKEREPSGGLLRVVGTDGNRVCRQFRDFARTVAGTSMDSRAHNRQVLPSHGGACSRHAIPLFRLGVIFFNAPAVAISKPELALSGC